MADYDGQIIESSLTENAVIIQRDDRDKAKDSIMMTASAMPIDKIAEYLGDDADDLLNHHSTTIPKENLALPGADFAERIWLDSDRRPQVLRSLQQIYDHGRLGGTGYVSILPVDQGIEHAAGASFAANPAYFDPAKIIELAMAGGCNAVASTFGVLGMTARRYAHRIPYIVKVNHNELVSFPNTHEQIMFGAIKQAWDMGALAVGATVYFGSTDSNRQMIEVAQAFACAHELGMATVLWCYMRNAAFTVNGINHETSADLTGQANHLGATLGADIVKQKLPTSNGGYHALNSGDSSYGKLDERIYSQLASDHPIDLTRYQVANGYMGKVGLISSGGASGMNDFAEAVKTAVINKRAGGMGLISGRKAFQRPMSEGVRLLNAIQDVYLNSDVTIA